MNPSHLKRLGRGEKYSKDTRVLILMLGSVIVGNYQTEMKQLRHNPDSVALRGVGS